MAEPPREGLLSRSELRRLLDALLPSDSELNSLVFEQVPALLAHFHPGLTRTAKVDLLLENADPESLVRALRARGLRSPGRRQSEVFDASPERQRHLKLLGLESLLESLLSAIERGGWVVVTGTPGSGKTALLVAALQVLEQRRQMPVPHHFLSHRSADSTRPGVILRSLAAQVEALYPNQVDLDASPELRLIQLLSRVARDGVEPGQELILLIDGLDEAETVGRANPFPRFLPSDLPPGVTVVCSIDPHSPHHDWLMHHAKQRLGGMLELSGAARRSEAEKLCEAIVGTHSKSLVLIDAQVRQAARAALGNPLCAHKLVELMQEQQSRGVTEAVLTRDLPHGLDALFARLFRGLSNETKAALGLICAARQPIPCALLDDLLGLEPGEAQQHLQSARVLLDFPSSPPGVQPPLDCVGIAHRAFVRPLQRALGVTAMYQSQRQIAAATCAWPPLEDSLYAFRRLYALRHAITQHMDADAISQASQVITSVDYMLARSQTYGSAALAEDLEYAAARCSLPESARTFSDLAQALRMGAHWIALDNTALPGIVYNLLRCAGWLGPTIERVLSFPSQHLRFRLAHPLQRHDASTHTFASHWDSVVSCQILPDDMRMLSVGLDRTIRLWDLNSGALLMHFYGFAGPPSAYVITQDGKSLVYATDENALLVCDLATGAPRRKLCGHTAPISVCALHPDGTHILTGARDQLLKLWDLETGSERLTLSGHDSAVIDCLISSDGELAISAGWDHTVRVFSLTSTSLLHTFKGHEGAVSALAMLPDGQHVASASWDNTVQIWNVQTGLRRAVLKGHAAPINALAISQRAGALLSASDDCTIRLWDLQAFHELRTLVGHSAAVKDCLLSSDELSVLSVAEDGTARQWDLASGNELRRFDGHLGPVLGGALTRDQRKLLTCSEDKSLKLWDLSRPPELGRTSGHVDAILACHMLPTPHALTASLDGTLKLWDLQAGHVLRTFVGHSDGVTSCAVTPDGRSLVSGALDGRVILWDIATGTELGRFGEGPLASVAARQSGRHLTIPSDDHMIELWGMPLDSSRRTEGTQLGRVRACAVTPDGRHLLVGSSDRHLSLWDLSTGAEILRFVGHQGVIHSCTLLPDGKHMLSSSSDRTMILWQLETGTELLRFVGHTGAVHACALSPQGTQVLSASHDKTLRLWDLQTGDELIRLHGHSAPVTSCLITEDGRRAISASLDYTLRVWELTSGMCIDTIYGGTGFCCLGTRGDWLCAGDQTGNIWILRDHASMSAAPDPRLARQSLMESVRKILTRSNR